MRRSDLLLLVLACASAQAQPLAVPPPAEARTGQRVVTGVAGVAGGVAAMVGARKALGSVSDSADGVILTALTYAAGATLTMQAVGEVFGDRVPLRVTVQDVALGVAAGTVVGVVAGGAGAGAGYLVERYVIGNTDYVYVGAAVGALLGGAAGVVTLVTVSTRHVGVAPAALAGPAGEAGAGLRLTVGL